MLAEGDGTASLPDGTVHLSSGYVRSVAADFIVLQYDGGPHRFEINEDTCICINGVQATSAELALQNKATVVTLPDSGTAIRVHDGPMVVDALLGGFQPHNPLCEPATPDKQLGSTRDTDGSVPVSVNYQDAADAFERGDYATALKVLKVLAEAGEARAQNSLGRMIQNGQSLIQDDQKDEVAVRWFRLAAEQGHGDAQNTLGYMYRNGKGVPQDYIQAHMWWDIAASQRADFAAQNLYDLRKLMSPADISAAEDLARECVAKKHKGCLK